MAGTYKAFFRYDKYWWIPVQAFYVRLTGIPDFILLSSPGLNIDIFKELVEVRWAQTLTLTVSDATGYSIIGEAALNGMKPRYYSSEKQIISMTFAVEKWSNGKIIERIWVQDEKASVESMPSIYHELYSHGWEFSLRLPSVVLLGNVPAPGS